MNLHTGNRHQWRDKNRPWDGMIIQAIEVDPNGPGLRMRLYTLRGNREDRHTPKEITL